MFGWNKQRTEPIPTINAGGANTVLESDLDGYFEVIHTLLLVLDVEGRVTKINQFGLDLLGYKREEIMGKVWWEICVPERYKNEIMNVFKAADVDAIAFESHENPVLTKSGEEREIKWHNAILRNQAGKIIGQIATGEDITESKQTEQRISANELFLEQVIDNIPAMIFVKDAKDLRFMRFNRAGADLVGVTTQEMMGKNDYDFFPKNEAEAFIAYDKQVLAEGKLLDVPEEEIKTKNQGIRLLHTKKIPIMDEEGKPLYLLGISEDITERKKFELELKQFKQGIERSNDVVFMTDKNGLFTYINFAFEELYGYKLEEIKASTPRILKSGKNTSEFYKEYWNTLNRGSVVSTKLINKKKDGSLITITTTTSPIINEAKQVVGFLAIQRDVTKEEEAEAALSARAEELERMNKVMIGREMRMVELKNEIKRLTGEEPKAGGEE